VRITYDPRKRELTLAERKLDFEEAKSVFEGPNFEFDDLREAYGERRVICYGYLHDRLVVVGYTPRNEERHVFTMRKANEREKKRIEPIIKKSTRGD
jgi:uncharacterized protein